MGIANSANIMLFIRIITAGAWAYIFTDFFKEKILKETRSPGRPTKRYYFAIFLISLLINYLLFEWISRTIASAPWIVFGLLILAFYAAKNRGLLRNL